MRKKYFLIIIVLLFVLCSCSLNSLSPAKITTDAAVMNYVSMNHPVVIEEEKIVKELTAIYNTLKLKKVKKELDQSSTISITYYENKKEKAVLFVDKNGLLYLYRDEENIYKVLNSNFKYKRVDEIYNTYKDKK